MRAEGIVYVSELMRRCSNVLYNNRNSVVIHNFPLTNSFCLTNDTQIGLSREVIAALNSQDAKFLTLSGMRRIKGHREMIIAFARYVDITKGGFFFIAGEGEEELFLKDLVHDLGLAERVFFVGFVSGNLKKYFLKRTTCYINCAFFEPFGLTFYEAADARAWIIYSWFSGGAEFLHQYHRAKPVNPHSVDDIVAAMLSINPKDYVEKDEVFWSRSFGEFCISKHLENLLTLWRE
jgi:glycosyltransferase involved in cell wall biosynthesis